MMLRATRSFVLAAIVGVVFLTGCGGSTSPSPALGAPSPIFPSSGAPFAFSSQPITLTVSNISVSSGSVTYTFEVATDSAFSNKVQTKTAAQGPNNQTSVVLDPLSSSGTFYWHVRAQSGSTVGPFSGTQAFAVVSFASPTTISPVNGGTYSSWPTLVVADVSRSGNSDPLSYKFDISTSTSFSPILVTATVPETPGQTSFTPPQSAVSSPATFHWQVTVIDQTTNQSGPPTGAQSFTVSLSAAAQIAIKESVVLWPGEQPPGTAGHATLGDNWGVQTVQSFDGVVHQVPTIDELRVFDAIDHGLDPQAAIDWMDAHGYSTNAVWYPGPAVVGFPFEYIAFVNGSWNMVIRAGG